MHLPARLLRRPGVRRPWIGGALFAWNEARLRRSPQSMTRRKLYEAWVGDRNVAATALVRGAGYEAITYAADMVRASVDDLPDHLLPEGLEIRPVNEDQLREIWEADIEAFRDHWGYVEQTEADYERFLAFPYHDPTLWKIAWDDEGVAGQVKSFIDTAENRGAWPCARLDRSDLDIAALAPPRRRKGLIVESIRELAARGMTEVALGVHTENPNGAYDLYAGLGYEVVKTVTTYREPLR